MISCPLVHHFVDLTCRDSSFHMGTKVIHQLCVDTSCTTHRILVFFTEYQLLGSLEREWSVGLDVIPRQAR